MIKWLRQHFSSQAGLLLLISWMLSATSFATFAQTTNPFSNDDEFLPVAEAFNPEIKQRNGQWFASFTIEPGYYLYQHQFAIYPADAQPQAFSFPPAEPHHDEFFGETQIYRQYVELQLPIDSDYPASEIELQYQGCADAGLCYPPTRIKLTQASPSRSSEPAVGQAALSDVAPDSEADSWQLAEQSLLVSLGVFFLLGIGLAFTPCVFPMYPILSSVVIGDKPKTLKNTLWLSFIYVQGMAITYSLLGLVVALAGMQYQAYFQHPAVLIVLSVAFAAFALSMLGAYTLQLPARWQSKLQTLSGQQQGGNTLGVFVIGVISGLVASPCTTAPLSGALLYIAQSGDVISGAAILYALSLGMGVPLIIFAVSGGKLLPKAGAWMNLVKHAFGWLLLAVVVFLLERLLSTSQAMWLWILYFVALATHMAHHLGLLRSRLAQILLYLVLVAGTVTGIHWQLQKQQLAEQAHALFEPVTNLEQIQAKVAAATQQQQWVMIDLYADWCVACKEFEQYTFSDAKVQAALADMTRLQADVTATNRTNQAILDHYQVLGLPTVLFINPEGQEVTAWRVTGFKDADSFRQHVKQMKSAQQQ